MGIREPFAVDGRGRTLHDFDHPFEPLVFHSFPIQATILAALPGKVEGIPVEQHMEQTGGQGEEIIARLDRRTVVDAMARVQRVAVAHRLAGFGHRIVIGQNHFPALDDDVARADIAMYQTNLMQSPERVAQVSQPAQQEVLQAGLAQIIGMQGKHAGQVRHGDSLDPFHQGNEAIRLPLGGNFVDRRKVRVDRVGAHPAIGAQRDLGVALVVDQFRNVAAEDFIGARIDFDDLEGLADAATAEAADDLEVRPLEGHYGVFVPVLRRRKFERRLGKRRGVPLQIGGQFGKRLTPLRIMGATLFQELARFAGARFVPRENGDQAGAKGIHVRPRIRSRQAILTNLRGNIRGVLPEIRRGKRNGQRLVQAGQAEVGEQRASVVANPQGMRRDVPVNDALQSLLVRLMKFRQRQERLARVAQAVVQTPVGVLGTFGERWRAGVDQGEPVQLARIPLGFLEGVEQVGQIR